MRASPGVVLAAYLLVMFSTLPLLPPLVTLVRDRLGAGALSGVLWALIAVLLLPPLGRLASSPRPHPPWPHLSFCALVILTAVALRILVSSPIGRVHLVEYGLLAVLILRVLPRRPGIWPFLAALAAASTVGLVDETVQHFLPNRVFDWYDVGLNSAAALLGLLTAAWWTWTSPGREETLFREGGPGCG